jgi:hypothetical protein
MPDSAAACPLLEIIVLETGRTNVHPQEYRVDRCVEEARKETPAQPKDSATPVTAWGYPAPA